MSRAHPMNTPKPKRHYATSMLRAARPVCGTSAGAIKTNDRKQVTCQHCLRIADEAVYNAIKLGVAP